MLVGTGRMAKAYTTVLKALRFPFDVVGRSERSAKQFVIETGIHAHFGGIYRYVKRKSVLPSVAIVAVNVEQLAPVTLLLLKNGVKRLLVEKPGGLNVEEIEQVAEEAALQQAQVYVAYNRRFYTSVQKAQQIAATDGGVCSFTFDFTELAHQVALTPYHPKVKESWFLANSSHVVDLAFYLGGEPQQISCYTSGGRSWHPTASIFSGAGITKGGVLFSYHANWEAPGRWGVEVMTKQHRLILRPLESLYVQKRGTFDVEEVKLEDELDRFYKPGLFRQVEAFLKKEQTVLVTIEQQRKRTAAIFSLIGRGKRM